MAAATSHCGNRWLRGSVVAPGPLFVAIGEDEKRKTAPMSATNHLTRVARPSTSRIIVASVVGTAIEFYDFYIYGTAAALVLGQMFFPARASGAQSLAAFATFGIAFFARPLGAFLFGHFGDRIGRKSTLVASLLTMGLSTTFIGLLPGYASAGAAAPALLCILRLGQGIGLGGEWGGAALLATENAPAGRSAWFGMFPQLGPSIGFLLANGLFLLLFELLTPGQFTAWGWRIPFLASALLVAVGLYVRGRIGETPAFLQLAAQHAQLRVPLGEVLRKHSVNLALGSLAMVTSYANFYISSVFALDYGTRIGQIPRGTFLGLLCIAVVAMAVMTLISARLSDRFGCRRVLLVSAALAALGGFAMAPLLGAHSTIGALIFLVLELGIMGLVFAPMGALLPALFPPEVRYTGASAAYNLGGILGASLAPYAAQLLLARGGLPWVGFYLTAAGSISFVAALLIKEFPAQAANTISAGSPAMEQPR
jgi:MFS family permease